MDATDDDDELQPLADDSSDDLEFLGDNVRAEDSSSFASVSREHRRMVRRSRAPPFVAAGVRREAKEGGARRYSDPSKGGRSATSWAGERHSQAAERLSRQAERQKHKEREQKAFSSQDIVIGFLLVRGKSATLERSDR